MTGRRPSTCALNGDAQAVWLPWLSSLHSGDDVAIVVSGRMLRLDEWGHVYGPHFARLFEAYVTCLHAHHPASYVFVEDLKPDTFTRYKAILIVGQTVEMEPALADALKKARAAKVRVVHDGTCRPELVKEFEPLGLSFNQFEKDPRPAEDDHAYWRLFPAIASLRGRAAGENPGRGDAAACHRRRSGSLYQRTPRRKGALPVRRQQCRHEDRAGTALAHHARSRVTPAATGSCQAPWRSWRWSTTSSRFRKYTPRTAESRPIAGACRRGSSPCFPRPSISVPLRWANDGVKCAGRTHSPGRSLLRMQKAEADRAPAFRKMRVRLLATDVNRAGRTVRRRRVPERGVAAVMTACRNVSGDQILEATELFSGKSARLPIKIMPAGDRIVAWLRRPTKVPYTRSRSPQ